MRLRVALVALLVVLAGCNTLLGQADTSTPTPTDADGAATEWPTVTPPDPAEDRLGFEGGYWYNETIAVDNADGLNDSELDAVLNRTMARIEEIRGLEFEEPVGVEIIDRDELRSRLSGNYTETFRAFDNAKFEAMLLVGSDTDSLAVQEANRGASILGFYDPRNGSLALVSDSGQPRLRGDGTLAHELQHALQDQHFNLTAHAVPTRDAVAGRNGLVEGEASLVETRYVAACGEVWSCIQGAGDGGSGIGSEFHWGVYFLNFFPYSEGPAFVHAVNATGGWSAVSGLYADVPASAEQVIYPPRYGEDPPVDVELSDSNGDGWERVRPAAQRAGQVRPDYAVIGQSGLGAMFAHTFSSALPNSTYGSYNRSVVVQPNRMINPLGRSDPAVEYVSYDLNYTNGWEGDRLHAYERDGEIGYVWRLVWENESEADEFHRGYRKVLSHWGGDPTGDGTWVIPEESPFTGAIYVAQDGDTITIAKAPTVDGLSGVYGPYPG